MFRGLVLRQRKFMGIVDPNDALYVNQSFAKDPGEEVIAQS